MSEHKATIIVKQGVIVDCSGVAPDPRLEWSILADREGYLELAWIMRRMAREAERADPNDQVEDHHIHLDTFCGPLSLEHSDNVEMKLLVITKGNRENILRRHENWGGYPGTRGRSLPDFLRALADIAEREIQAGCE